MDYNEGVMTAINFVTRLADALEAAAASLKGGTPSLHWQETDSSETSAHAVPVERDKPGCYRLRNGDEVEVRTDTTYPRRVDSPGNCVEPSSWSWEGTFNGHDPHPFDLVAYLGQQPFRVTKEGIYRDALGVEVSVRKSSYRGKAGYGNWTSGHSPNFLGWNDAGECLAKFDDLGQDLVEYLRPLPQPEDSTVESAGLQGFVCLGVDCREQKFFPSKAEAMDFLAGKYASAYAIDLSTLTKDQIVFAR